MTNALPLVSVIISTYRRDESLVKAVASCVNQTYKNIEILIADDNADSRMNRRVREIADRFSVTHIQNETNLGSAENRNNAVRLSKGEYIAFLDDDDVYFETKIEKQLRHMLSEQADVCIENLRLVNEKGEFVENRTRGYLSDFSREALWVCHLKYHMSGTDSLMFKREYFDKIGGFPPINLGDEFYLMARAIEGGGKITYHNETGSEAVVHSDEGGLSSGNNKLICERELHKFKRSHMHLLNRRDRRYIRMRHHAVNAFAYLRMKKYARFAACAFLSFGSAPVQCLSFLKEKFSEKEAC